jgi:hypothetical protein
MRRAGWKHLVLVAMSASLAGCDPFARISVDEGFVVADGNGAMLELLAPDRRLPASAKNIAGHVMHFQDTSLTVRFDAPLADARAFQAEMLKGKGGACGLWRRAKVPGWPQELPKGGECLEDRTDDDDAPPITVTVVPRGAEATVYIVTFA